MAAPVTVVLDVNETLSDLAPMTEVFADLGAPGHLAATWFASVLRDGFARLLAGAQEEFATVGRGAARVLLADAPLTASLDDAVERVMAGFLDLPVHPDVPGGLRALKDAGHRVVTLTNGSTEVSDRLFRHAGVRDLVDRLISAQEAGLWKPALGAYAYGAEVCGTELGSMLLVAVHPWDIDGAARAGMRTAWIDRHGAPYPEHFRAPDITVPDLGSLTDPLA
jgi:2-haloacid dehalogenase